MKYIVLQFFVAYDAASFPALQNDRAKYWAAPTHEFDYKLKPGAYSLQVQFVGKRVTRTNLDTQGLALMPYWEGIIASNELRFASVDNNCNYCAAAHSTIAKGFLHAAPEIVSAIRNSRPVADKKTDALVNLTREIVRERGFVKQAPVDAFLSAGYRKDQIMELLLGVAMKTISNYLDHISPTPLDQAFEAEKVR